MIVYKAVNTVNGKMYVGITRYTLEQRLAGHMCTGRTPFQKALRKYGREMFEFSVIASTDDWDELCKLEIEWIVKLGCKAPRGYNLTAGGEGVLDPDGSIRAKISEYARTHHPSTATKEKIREAMRNRQLSEDHKRKIGAAHQGKVYSAETRKKIGIASSQKKMSSIARLMIWLWNARERSSVHNRSMENVKRQANGRFAAA